MAMNSDLGFGNGFGWSDGPNSFKNPYAQGGALFGQGYGDHRNVLPNPPQAQNWNAAPTPQAAPANAATTPGDMRSIGRAIQSSMGQLPGIQNQTPQAQTALPQYTSGIEAGPVWGQPQMTAASNAIANQRFSMPTSVSGVGMAGDSQRLASDLAMGNGATDSLAFTRAGEKTNADQLYNSQSARANSGVQGGNWLAGLNATNLTNQAAMNGNIMGIISSLLGSL